MLKNDFFGFPKVKWLHLTGEVDRSVRSSCQIFSWLTYENYSNRSTFERFIQKIKKWVFFEGGGHSVVSDAMHAMRPNKNNVARYPMSRFRYATQPQRKRRRPTLRTNCPSLPPSSVRRSITMTTSPFSATFVMLCWPCRPRQFS